VRAVVSAGEGAVAVADVADPVLAEPDDAIVRVTRAAICRSDLHFVHGKAPIEPGDVLGHEAVGVVEAVGNGVRGVAVGERVAISFHARCGACWFCTHDRSGLCEEQRIFGGGLFGGDLPGTQAEAARVPHAEANLLRLDDALDDDRGVFLGDVGSTAVATAALAEARPEDTVAVLGLGPVGLLTIQALRASDVERVVALDREPDRLALAETFGATPVHVGERNPEMALAGLTDDRGADVVIEAVGHPDAFASALDVVRRGGRVVVAGMYAGERAELQLGVWWARALDVRFLGLCSVHAWWEETAAMLGDGRLGVEALITHRLPLEEAPTGYELFDRREATKVLLAP
jgi:alcohol dehydrogenase